jgi:hypothetical protein
MAGMAVLSWWPPCGLWTSGLSQKSDFGVLRCGVAERVGTTLDAHRIRRTGHSRAWSHHVDVPHPQNANGKTTTVFDPTDPNFIHPEGT